ASRRRHTRFSRDWSSDVCSSDLGPSVRDRSDLCGLPQRPRSALAAGQLLAQGGQRLVRGQRTGVVRALGGVRTATGRGRSSGLAATLGSGLLVRLAGLDDLRLVLLEAALRPGVLAPPP